jgi:hypothetical protein
VFGSEISSGEAWDPRIEKDGLKLKGLAEIAYWVLTTWFLLAGSPQLLSVISVLRRSWSLREPSRARRWGKIE